MRKADPAAREAQWGMFLTTTSHDNPRNEAKYHVYLSVTNVPEGFTNAQIEHDGKHVDIRYNRCQQRIVEWEGFWSAYARRNTDATVDFNVIKRGG